MNNREQHPAEVMMAIGRAAKSKGQGGREGWCVIFFHPARLDDQGRALRVRRGLGTRDAEVADVMVADLNEMLADVKWHTPVARDHALRRFHERAVAIFFDSMEAEMPDGWALREETIPLPGQTDGYCRVLFTGTTGSGKTTVIRQLIGSDPDRDRFPSTSTARTTVADMEIIIATGPFRAAVTFFPRDRVRGLIEECVVAAIATAAEVPDDARVLARLLEHSEQRFRLSYLLGTLAAEADDEENWDDVPSEPAGPDQAAAITSAERENLKITLRGYVRRCRIVGESMREALGRTLATDGIRLVGGERDAFLELLEEEAGRRDSESFTEIQSIVDDILDDVESRFSVLEGGTLDRARSGWPSRWVFEDEERSAFIRNVNQFSSNTAAQFGQLLTPLVQGIRVSGPFAPEWLAQGAEAPRLVLLDGEGLGHTSESGTSLPTTLTRRFQDVDVIALVDSATQPMLAGPAAVLRTAAARGHDGKLMVLFTHFDEVKGANLPNMVAKQEHVHRSLGNALTGFDDALGGTTVRGLLRNLEGKIFFLAGTDHRLDLLAKPAMRRFTEGEFRSFLSACVGAIRKAAPLEAHPIYDVANLVLSLAGATSRFQDAWGGRLGVEVRVGTSSEHWMRVKALSRRFAEWDADEYHTMRPVADLLQELTQGLAKFLSTPRAWEPADAPDALKQAALEAVRRNVSAALDDLTTTRLRRAPLVDWRGAYRLAGAGSGRHRARAIWEIYRDAAPRITDIPTPEAMSFLDAVRELFTAAVEKAGGTVR